MKAILIPVKLFAESKKRLAPRYSAQARAELAAAMCEDLFRVVEQVRSIGRVFVVSQEPRALAWAEQRGWKTIVEHEQISESHSVDTAALYCAAQGVTALLRLPIDIPLATPADVESVLAAADTSPCAVIVPSCDGTGTNALLRSPATLFPSHFGPGSFVLHVEEAQRCGARARILPNLNLELDVDDAADLDMVKDSLRADSAFARWHERYALSK